MDSALFKRLRQTGIEQLMALITARKAAGAANQQIQAPFF